METNNAKLAKQDEKIARKDPEEEITQVDLKEEIAQKDEEVRQLRHES